MHKKLKSKCFKKNLKFFLKMHFYHELDWIYSIMIKKKYLFMFTEWKHNVRTQFWILVHNEFLSTMSITSYSFHRRRVLPHPQFLYERVFSVLWDLQGGTWLAMEHIRPWKRLEIFDNDIQLWIKLIYGKDTELFFFAKLKGQLRFIYSFKKNHTIA